MTHRQVINRQVINRQVIETGDTQTCDKQIGEVLLVTHRQVTDRPVKPCGVVCAAALGGRRGGQSSRGAGGQPPAVLPQLRADQLSHASQRGRGALGRGSWRRRGRWRRRGDSGRRGPEQATLGRHHQGSSRYGRFSGLLSSSKYV